ncbi:MAG: hypothetical protein AAGE52_28080 [Myxococcota bacterium]
METATTSETTGEHPPIAPDAKVPEPDENQVGEQDDRSWSAGRMSLVEADQYAEAFRPSWGDADDWVEANQAPEIEEAADTVVAAPEPKAFSRMPEVAAVEEEAILPGADQSKKRLAIVAVVFVTAIVVVVASFLGGGDEPSQPVATDSEGVEESAETAPTPMTAAAEIPQPETMAAVPEATMETEAEVEAATEPAPEPVPEPVQVRIRARVTPANARLELDGTRVGNPFDREVEQDGSEHVFRATATGYEPQEFRVRWDGEHNEVVELREVPPVVAPPPAMRPEAMRAEAMRAEAMRAEAMRSTPMRTQASSRMTTRMRSTMRSTMRRRSTMRSGFTTANPY